MFEALGRRTYRSRRLVLALAGVFVLVAVTWGSGVFDKLAAGGFDNPDSESGRALTRIEADFGRNDVDVVALYRSDKMTVDDPTFRFDVEQVLRDLPASSVRESQTFW